ncbi:unnamed protein product [Kuraishia capsulata CBS 1993]|uniref:Uncharacterized protein n=1 Tax=Kuraishia capsulata CBS 1993 TaxID=1382522 RepID=W6MPU9_9ASCO|nr:uncharacterized protein KUCA_T00004345001 [Kuraishia capsulata CBS 1993]CDK28363.1 unnamed protein product [Kuraishia capsulata CBS 1993]
MKVVPEACLYTSCGKNNTWSLQCHILCSIEEYCATFGFRVCTTWLVKMGGRGPLAEGFCGWLSCRLVEITPANSSEIICYRVKTFPLDFVSALVLFFSEILTNGSVNLVSQL